MSVNGPDRLPAAAWTGSADVVAAEGSLPARLAAMRAAAGPPPRAPGERPAPAPAGPPTPADPYANWFTDADKLEAPRDVRRYLDQALRTGRHDDIRALRNIDVNMASPAEKAR